MDGTEPYAWTGKGEASRAPPFLRLGVVNLKPLRLNCLFYLKKIKRMTSAIAAMAMIKSAIWSRCCLRRLLDDINIDFPCFGVSK